MSADSHRSEDTIAILLGASSWPDLEIPRGESFLNSFEDFKSYLGNPEGLALPDSHVLSIFDTSDSTDTITGRVLDFLNQHGASKGKIVHNLIVYLLGQGHIWEGEFYFGIHRSRRDQYPTTFFPANGIAKMITEGARNCCQYIIIDACHSAAAEKASWMLPKGACLLCSARDSDLSKSKSLTSSSRIRTQFSGALLDILYGLNGTESAEVDQISSPKKYSFETLHELIKKRVKKLYGVNAVLPELRSVKGPRIEGIPLFPKVSVVPNSEIGEKVERAFRAIEINKNSPTADEIALLGVGSSEIPQITAPSFSITPQSTNRLFQLPTLLLDFVGREAEIHEIVPRLAGDSGRMGMLALKGMGGVGKTTLAIRIAHLVKDQFPDAQLFLDMQGLSENPVTTAEAMASILQDIRPVLGKPPDSTKELAQHYRSALASRRVLIVLDNVRDEAQVKELLAVGPSTKFIITSRKTLRLSKVDLIQLDVLPREDSLKLIHGIMGDRGSVDELALLSDLCGHLPLALRVAGDFLRTSPNWTVTKYILAIRNERDRLHRLKGATLDDDVEFVLAFSAIMLVKVNPNTAARWQMLSVFPGSFDALAAAAIWDFKDNRDPDIMSTEDELTLLLDRSLLSFDSESGRYELHDLIQLVARNVFKYLTDHPLDAGTDERIHTAHLRFSRHYCEVLATSEELYLQGKVGVARGLALFDSEADNIRHGWRRAVNSLGVKEYSELARDYPLRALHVAGLRVPECEMKKHFEQALTASSQLGDRRSEGRAITGLAESHFDLGQFRASITFYERGISIACEVGDRLGEGMAINGLGEARAELGETQAAITIYERALAAFQEVGDRRREGQVLGSLGRAYTIIGDIPRAVRLFDQWMKIAQEIGDQWSEGQATGCFGLAHASLGNLQEAIKCYVRWLAITQKIGYKRGEAAALGNLGHAHANLGDYNTAVTYYEQWRSVAKEIGHHRGEGDAIGNLGRIYAEQGDIPKSLLCMEQRLAIAKETEDAEAEGYALIGIARIMMLLGRREDAIQYAKQSQGRFELVKSDKAEDVRLKLVEWSQLTTDSLPR